LVLMVLGCPILLKSGGLNGLNILRCLIWLPAAANATGDRETRGQSRTIRESRDTKTRTPGTVLRYLPVEDLAAFLVL
jgi:hypothetical protein